MEYRSDVAAPAETATAKVGSRQRRHRQKIQSLAYVNLDHANGGIIRNLSEAGIAIQAVAPLHANQQVHLHFELLSPRLRVEATGRVAWADSTAQAGVEFLAIPHRSRRLLKDWLLTQLLATAHQAAWDSIFIQRHRGEEATELLFSAAPRPTIRLDPEETDSPKPKDQEDQEDRPVTLHLAWCPVPISPRTLAWLVDGLILLSAALIFCVLSLAMTQVFPSGQVALALVLGITSMFATLYWFLFVVWIGATPGTRLAQFLGSDSDGMSLEEDDTPRFR
jgi:PilZ domain-containing protein/RDD family protein